MAGGFPRGIGFDWLSRTSVRVSLASLLLIATNARSVHNATADGDTRTLSFYHTHSGEDLTVTFKRNGRYDEAALKKLNYFLRDWRSQDQTTMDRRLFDIVWEVYRDVDGKQPIKIISAYRSPATNAMLRRRSSGVARHSQHMQGHAMDFFIPGVPLEQIRFAGLRLQRGGVGFYPTSGSPFVHLDVGGIRHWPRMTHDQLARVFPDGRTVHVPSDGRPLVGYQLAMADIQKRGKSDDGFAFQKPKTLFASLFKSKTAGDEDDETPAAASAPAASAPAAARPAPAPVVTAAAAIPAAPVPLPRAKPAITASYQVASADTPVPPAPIPAKTESEPRFRTPADIINSRGFWGDTPPTKPKQATPAQVAALTARQALAAAVDPQPTASIDHAFHALAYAPVPSPLDRAHIVAASAPVPRHQRPRPAAKSNPMSVNEVTTVVAKGRQSLDGRITVSTRLAAANNGDTVWMRAMILSPSATTAMSSTVFGEPDMTAMRAHFVKPQVTVAAGFTDDPQAGMVCDRFTGSAVASLTTLAFQTAALR